MSFLYIYNAASWDRIWNNETMLNKAHIAFFFQEKTTKLIDIPKNTKIEPFW